MKKFINQRYRAIERISGFIEKNVLLLIPGLVAALLAVIFYALAEVFYTQNPFRKRIMASVVAVAMMFTALPVVAGAAGYTGNTTGTGWYVDNDILYITSQTGISDWRSYLSTDFEIIGPGLKAIVIHDNVISIPANTFNFCYNIKYVKFLGTAPPDAVDTAFGPTNSPFTPKGFYVYVPNKGAESSYTLPLNSPTDYSRFTLNVNRVKAWCPDCTNIPEECLCEECDDCGEKPSECTCVSCLECGEKPSKCECCKGCNKKLAECICPCADCGQPNKDCICPFKCQCGIVSHACGDFLYQWRTAAKNSITVFEHVNNKTKSTINHIPSVIKHKGKEYPVTELGLNLFRNNTSLKELYIPASITQVRGLAIFNCTNLEKIIFMSKTPPTLINNAFPPVVYNLPSLTNIYVPTQARDTYILSPSLTSNPNSYPIYEMYGITHLAASDVFPFDCAKCLSGPFPNTLNVCICDPAIVCPDCGEEDCDGDCDDGGTDCPECGNDPCTCTGGGDDTDCPVFICVNNCLFYYPGEYKFNADGETIAIKKYTGQFDDVIYIPEAIHDKTVTWLTNGAFGGHEELRTVTISKTVTTIEDGVFSGCINLTTLTFLGEIPPAFGSNVFTGTGLEVIYVPRTAISAYKNALSVYSAIITCVECKEIPCSCNGGTNPGEPCPDCGEEDCDGSCDISGTAKCPVCSQADCDYFLYSKYDFEYNSYYNTITITKYKGTEKEFEIPEKIHGRTVTRISSPGFSQTDIISVTIPDTVTIIDGYSFFGCTSLLTLTFEGAVPPVFGSNALEFCDEDLTIFVLPDSVSAYKTALSVTGFSDNVVPIGECNGGCAPWGDWEIKTPATCLDNGVEFKACKNNIHKEFETIYALGHTAGTPANCETAQTCIRCDYEYNEKLHHVPSEPATCTTAQICTRNGCNEVFAEALGHDYGEPATCTKEQTCTREGCDYIFAEMTDHIEGAPATCTAAQTCTECVYEFTPALGHAGAVAICGQPQTCVRCEVVLVEEVQHIWDDDWWVVLVEPTCTEGTRFRMCANLDDKSCLANQLESTATGHTPKEGNCAQCEECEAKLTRTCAAEAPCKAHTPKKSSGGGSGGIGYYVSPVMPSASETTATAPAGSSPVDTSPANAGDEIDSITAINAAVKRGDTRVILSEKQGSLINPQALKSIKESGKIMQVTLPNNLVISIDPTKITSDAKLIDLYIDIVITNKQTVIGGVTIPANSIMIIPAAHGDFGFEITIHLSALQLAGLDGNSLRLFYVGDNRVITDKGRVYLNSDGSAVIRISHASYYILTSENAEIIITEENKTTVVTIDNNSNVNSGESVNTSTGTNASINTDISAAGSRPNVQATSNTRDSNPRTGSENNFAVVTALIAFGTSLFVRKRQSEGADEAENEPI